MVNATDGFVNANKHSRVRFSCTVSGDTAAGRFMEGTHGALILREAHKPALLERLGEGRARGIPSEAAELAFAALGSDSPRPFRNTPHASAERGRISTERQNRTTRDEQMKDLTPEPL